LPIAVDDPDLPAIQDLPVQARVDLVPEAAIRDVRGGSIAIEIEVYVSIQWCGKVARGRVRTDTPPTIAIGTPFSPGKASENVQVGGYSVIQSRGQDESVPRETVADEIVGVIFLTGCAADTILERGWKKKDRLQTGAFDP
jgi:hypothetical protein